MRNVFFMVVIQLREFPKPPSIEKRMKNRPAIIGKQGFESKTNICSPQRRRENFPASFERKPPVFPVFVRTGVDLTREDPVFSAMFQNIRSLLLAAALPAAGLFLFAVLASAAEPIEFRSLLIIKRHSEAWSPGLLPVRDSMSPEEIESARRCFEVETPDMVREITAGRVRFTARTLVSEEPLRLWNPDRRDSAEVSDREMLAEFSRLAKPGEFDSVGYYFLPRDRRSGYSAPRAGYGVGWYDGDFRLGMFAVHATVMNPRDEIFLHEWLHGLERHYHGKSGVKLPEGWLHGNRNYPGYEEKPFRPQDTFHGWMTWYRDFMNGTIQGEGGPFGLGENAWRHGPIRSGQPREFPAVRRPEKRAYPAWLLALMKGETKGAKLGPDLLPAQSVKPLEGWSQWSWTKDVRVSEAAGAIVIRNEKPNHSVLSRKIRLEPERHYLFTAEVRGKEIEITEQGGRRGLDLAAMGSHAPGLITGSGEWREVSVPFSTGAKQGEISLELALGGRGSLARGAAAFRNPRLREILYRGEAE